jgi:RIP metalloprotease RseP
LRHHSSAIFRFLGSLVTPKKARKAAGMVGGPVAIVTYYIGMIKASVMLAVWFTGFLNMNLAIINLLPLPVLDGGHIVFSLWEAAARRPMHARVVNALVNAFAVLIIGVFVLLSLRDLDRHTPMGRLVRGIIEHVRGAKSAAGEGAAAGPSEAARP